MKEISIFQRVTPRFLLLFGALTLLSVIAVKANAINFTYTCEGLNCNTPKIKLGPKQVSQVRITCDKTGYQYIYRDFINTMSDSPNATCTPTDYAATPMYLVLCQNFDMKDSHQVSISWTCSPKKGSGPF